MVFDACYLTVTYSWYDSNPLARVVQASPVFSGGLDVKRNACSSAIKEWSVLTHVRHLSTIRGCVTNVCWLKGGNCIELLLNLVDQLSTAPCTFTFTKSNFTKHTLPVLHFEALQVSVQWPSHVPKLNSVKINCAAYLSMGSTTPPCDPKKLWLWMDFRKCSRAPTLFFHWTWVPGVVDCECRARTPCRCPSYGGLLNAWQSPTCCGTPFIPSVKRWNNLGFVVYMSLTKKRSPYLPDKFHLMFFERLARRLCCLSLRFSFLSTIKATWWWNVWWP